MNEVGYDNMPKKDDSNFWKLLCILCFIFLVIGVVYVLNNQYLENNVKLFNDGYINGTQDIVLILFNKAVKCETIPISNLSVGINLISIECLPEEVIQYLQGTQQNE